MTEVTMTWHVRENNLPAIKANMKRVAAMIVAKTALDWEAQAKSIASAKGVFDTGNLISSIQATKVSEFVWKVTVGAEYGIYNEYGTVKMAARPFFRPAGAIVRPQFLQALRRVMG